MGITIAGTWDTGKGKLLEISVEKKVLRIIFTWHALDSMQDYGISIENALNYMLFADEVIKDMESDS